MNAVYMIGNTHFDPVWLWTWDEAMASIRSTFRSALDRMNEDPDFTYSFCTPAVFEWIEQVDPGLFDEIRGRVAEGRWEIESEGWWLQPDCNAVSGESLARQGLYAQRYLTERFGKRARAVFNIDSFGHSAMVPQIMKKSGLDYYVFSRPNQGELAMDDALFEWESPDGSRVLAYRPGGQVGGEGYPQDVDKGIHDLAPHLKASAHDAMIVYGVSNHGGAPTRASIQAIRAAMGRADGYRVRFGGVCAFFDAQAGKEVPVWRCELQPRFYGAFSDLPSIKRDNRRAEYSLLSAEAASLLAKWLCGREYPAEALRQGWKDLMFNQFHDILGGTSIPEAYDDARNLHGRLMQNANEATHFALQSITRRVPMLGNNRDSVWNLCLFHLNASPFSGVLEAEVQWPWEFPWYFGGVELVDEAGEVIPAQVVLEKSVIPGFRTRFAFHAQAPAMGYRVYAVRQTGQPAERDYTPVASRSPFLPRVYEDAGDTWCFNTVAGYGPEAGEFRLCETITTERGPILTTVKQTWKYGESKFEEYITTYADGGQVDYRYRVNWNERHKVLKLLPTWADCPAEVAAAAPYGATTRPADGIEYPVGEWLSWRDKSGGATLLLDGVFAYDTRGALRLTVLRSPIYGDLRVQPLDGQADFTYMGQGVHTGRIRVLPAALSHAESAARAAQFHNPPIAVCEANHGGDLPGVYSGIQVAGEGAVVAAVKRAEDGEGVVVRLVEMDGGRREASVAVAGGSAHALPLAPYEIATAVFLPDGSVRAANLLEEAQGEDA